MSVQWSVDKLWSLTFTAFAVLKMRNVMSIYGNRFFSFVCKMCVLLKRKYAIKERALTFLTKGEGIYGRVVNIYRYKYINIYIK